MMHDERLDFIAYNAQVVGGRTMEKKDVEKLIETRAFINELHRYVSIGKET